MSEYQDFFTARLAENSTVPTLLCGHCQSILPPSRIFENQGENRYDLPCDIIGLCSADDCGAVNCCDEATKKAEKQRAENRIAV
ncbi:hypothetical protein SAMN05216203_2630 [Marinobacter daqiaonensis]|uniref:Uncharacterized protein n=1 Tax=Marinobacter daqiaonensis TaxID=650891 RepID=A0A1I6J4A0_9GAMM|nr:hypothetical protein [Marinobacter daqiaonensis]SFR73701.1 hypothetical protein SAMN05216203_2630 [Marinobacter daqiaonensis]